MLSTSRLRTAWPILALALLVGCDDDSPSGPADPPRSGTHFQMNLGTNEMAGMAYDRARDRLYVLENGSGLSRIHRYDFATGTLRQVLEFPSANDYGLRVFGDELWVARTYDDEVTRLTGLDADTLTVVGAYGPPSPEMNEVSDFAMVSGDLYVVCGNFLTSDQHNGIRMLAGPLYDSLVEIVDEVAAGWPDSAYVYTRSIVAGAPGELVVATGSNGDLVRYGTDGTPIAVVTGLGDAWLARDGQDRIYALDATEGAIRRFSPELDLDESFPDDGPYRNRRIAVRDVADGVELINVRFRDREPSFDWVRLPE